MLGRLSPRSRRNLVRVLPFGLIWFVFSQIFLFSDLLAIRHVKVLPEEAIQPDVAIYLVASFAVTTVGLLIGVVELLFLSDRFADKSLKRKLVSKACIHAAILGAAILVTYPVAASMEIGTSVFDVRVWERFAVFLSSATLLSNVVQLLTMLVVSLIYAEISEHIGHGILVNFFTGRYHRPKEETRIFMFSDMKSSTQIAEDLGHLRYFELLRAYYRDLSAGIVDYAGEIYQYVGDEVVVSWPVDRGIENLNCIRSFLAMKRDLHKRAAWYEATFGVVPDFKAAFHVGAVTTGEIGALKREIVFTGDVLNATARIQGLCNTHGVDLLISDELMSLLEFGPDAGIRSLGTQKLRGREREIELFTLAWESPVFGQSPSPVR